MEKEIKLNCDEALNYIKNNVDNYDILELSYNRIFVPGEVLDIDVDDQDGEERIKVLLQLTGELLNSTVQIDLGEIKNDILEIRHIKEEECTLIVVDA
jgi:hypothetical protein